MLRIRVEGEGAVIVGVVVGAQLTDRCLATPWARAAAWKASTAVRFWALKAICRGVARAGLDDPEGEAPLRTKGLSAGSGSRHSIRLPLSICNRHAQRGRRRDKSRVARWSLVYGYAEMINLDGILVGCNVHGAGWATYPAFARQTAAGFHGRPAIAANLEFRPELVESSSS